MIALSVNNLPSKLPKVAFYLSPEIKEDLETLAKLDKRSVSNLVYAWVTDKIEEAKREGKLSTKGKKQ